MDERVAVLVRLMVEVEVPLVVSSAAVKEAPAARMVKRMFEICILKRERCDLCDEMRRLIQLIQQSLMSVLSESTGPNVDGSSFRYLACLVNVIKECNAARGKLSE